MGLVREEGTVSRREIAGLALKLAGIFALVESVPMLQGVSSLITCMSTSRVPGRVSGLSPSRHWRRSFCW